MISLLILLGFLPSIMPFSPWPNINKFPIFQYLENFYENNQYLPSKSELLYPKVNSNDITVSDKYQAHWYSIGKKHNFPLRVPKKITIWGKEYVVWKKSLSEYVALSDTCSHGGKSLSDGYVNGNTITCSQHNSCFNENGELIYGGPSVLEGSNLYDIPSFKVNEQNDMLYLNTYENMHDNTILYRNFSFVNSEFRKVFIENSINIHPTILMENSLDVVHIIFAKLFTNSYSLQPINVVKIDTNNSLHHAVSYTYKKGAGCLLDKIFDSDELPITSEIIYPFTTITRIMIEHKEFVFETNIRPININKSVMYVRCYRNFVLAYGGDNFINEIIQKVMNVYTQMSLHTI